MPKDTRKRKHESEQDAEDSEDTDDSEDGQMTREELLAERKQNRREVKRLKRVIETQAKSSLASHLQHFISFTLSTSTERHNTSADKSIQAKYMTYQNILTLANIQLVAPLPRAQWDKLCKVKSFTHGASEKRHYHPGIQNIFNAVLQLAPDCPYKITSEAKFRDERKLNKIPDISVVTKDDGRGGRMISIVFPVEIKKKDKILEAIHQALGYLVTKLRDLYEISNSNNVFGVCVGITGEQLAVGYVSIKNGEIKVCSTNDSKIPFFHTHGKKQPMKETVGVRILRSLLAASPEQLGHVIDKAILKSNGKEFSLQNVLGRGSFCSAFAATVSSHSSNQLVVIKKGVELSHDLKPERTNPLQHMIRERDVLKQFTTARPRSKYLPYLYVKNWQCTKKDLFLPILPVGKSLDEVIVQSTKIERAGLAIQLFGEVNNALQAALQLGFFHSDVRPDNVVFAAGVFVLIDWGLARREGDNMHNYYGGIAFFHDDVIKAKISETQVLYKTEFDVQSAAYVAYALAEAQIYHLNYPVWHTLPHEQIIRARAKTTKAFFKKSSIDV